MTKWLLTPAGAEPAGVSCWLKEDMLNRGIRLLSASTVLTLFSACWNAAAYTETQRPTTAAQSSSQPSATSKPVAFQPGIEIDWSLPAVRAAGQIALRSGGLEFLACFHSREHESIMRLSGTATHLYMAMGLIGLRPGHPPVWNDTAARFDPPEGDLVDISVEWATPRGVRSVDAFAWLLDAKYGGKVAARPWVFCGSLRGPDGRLAADASGRGIALVDFPENLLTLSRRHASADADLWARAATAEIPPSGASVTLVLRAAAPRRHTATIDFRGDLHVDGRYVAAPEFADVINLELRLDPKRVQKIRVSGTLASDLRHAKRELERLGVKPESIVFVTDGPSSRGP